MVLFDDVLDDGQAQAGAADLAGTAGVGAVEAFEDTVLFVFRDTDTRVADREVSPVCIVADRDVDVATGPVVFDGVVDEVHSHFPEELHSA